ALRDHDRLLQRGLPVRVEVRSGSPAAALPGLGSGSARSGLGDGPTDGEFFSPSASWGCVKEIFAMKVLSALAAALCLVCLAAGSAIAESPAPSIGAAAPTFSLTTIDGKPFSLADAEKANSLVVVMFISTQCPYSNAYNDRMRDMAAAYAQKGVQFVGINSNKTETVQDAVDHAKKQGHTFTIVKAPENKVAAQYGASHTPEVYVIDKTGKLRYHGRIDENSDDAARVTSPDLKNALDALLGGQTVAKAETKAFGCSIKRV